MQEMRLFEYAVIRVVPKVEREEFLNVGVILYCRQNRFLMSMFKVDEAKLGVLSPTTDPADIEQHLRAFASIADGNKQSGPIGKLDSALRFRWLTATRSTIIQTSKVHPGLSSDPHKTLERLFGQLVL